MLPTVPVTAAPRTLSPLATVSPVTALLAGDCLTDSADEATHDDTEATKEDAGVDADVRTIPVLPCSETHDFEVFDRFPVAGEAFPGDMAVTAAAESGCASGFEGFTGMPYQDSSLDLDYFTPTERSWAEPGGRNVVCLIFDPSGAGTGSLKGAER
ncbi:septum formation family protein [Cryobacterium shii]|uniref:Septum formation-related domain-containing protein n=1 Tax=Cryobacterium shii TaxID=1259235 RepID=A0AAQ2C5J5_9MICO|nr:septum formation family protein [Cryobacterium shii]TFC44857.1 hypothetical protein E3O49_11135 [Cryobacterium shii]